MVTLGGSPDFWALNPGLSERLKPDGPNPDFARANADGQASTLSVDDKKGKSKLKPMATSTTEDAARSSHKPKAHPHDDFVRQIVDVAHLYGWRAVYWRAARTATGWATPVGGDGKDFPDLFLVRPRDAIGHERQYVGDRALFDQHFWEVKVGKDRVRPGQQEWLDILGGRVVTPADWDWIVETLR